MKSFTDLFIRRPVLAIVVNLVILIAGFQAIKTINVRQYPRSENAAITVTTVYVGADAELVRGFITTPLERAIAAADGIDYIQSRAAGRFHDHRPAEIQLRREQSAGRNQFQGRPGSQRSAAGSRRFRSSTLSRPIRNSPRLILSFTSNILAANEITDYLVRIVQPRLDGAQGRAKSGHSRRAHLRDAHLAETGSDGRLNINPAKCATLAKNNFLAAVGSTKGSLLQVNLTANTDLHTVEEFKQLVVRAG